MGSSERRRAILEVLCQRRQDTRENLAHEFGVSLRTISNDIDELTITYIPYYNDTRKIWRRHKSTNCRWT